MLIIWGEEGEGANESIGGEEGGFSAARKRGVEQSSLNHFIIRWYEPLTFNFPKSLPLHNFYICPVYLTPTLRFCGALNFFVFI